MNVVATTRTRSCSMLRVQRVPQNVSEATLRTGRSSVSIVHSTATAAMAACSWVWDAHRVTRLMFLAAVALGLLATLSTADEGLCSYAEPWHLVCMLKPRHTLQPGKLHTHS